MLDFYFKKPLLWDYLISLVISSLTYVLYQKSYISLPKEEYILPMASDLCTISLTLAGFILTLLTVLISFKSASKTVNNKIEESSKVFDLFFATSLYFQTVTHLKNCVKSLSFIAVFGFFLKIVLNVDTYKYIYFYNILGLLIIIFTLLRSLLILTKIINIQEED